MAKNIKWLEKLGEKVRLKNGLTGVIVEVTYDKLTVRLPSGQSVSVSEDEIVV